MNEEPQPEPISDDDEEFNADFTFDELMNRYHGNKRMTEKPIIRGEEVIVDRRARFNHNKLHPPKVSQLDEGEGDEGIFFPLNYRFITRNIPTKVGEKENFLDKA